MVDSAKLVISFQKRITTHALSRNFCRLRHIFADFVTLGLSNLAFQASLLTLGRVQASLTLLSLTRSLHPGSHRLSRLALEGISKCIITAVTTLQCQLLGSDGTLGIDSLAIETDEMIDAQIVDIGIVSYAMTGEIVGKISAISANGFGKLGKV
jgi:hypothetical protein